LKLADLKELKFWNLNLKINIMPDLGPLKFWPLVLASSGDPILKSCHKDLKTSKMKKFFRHENLIGHVIAGSPRIMGNIFPHLEVPKTRNLDPFLGS